MSRQIPRLGPGTGNDKAYLGLNLYSEDEEPSDSDTSTILLEKKLANHLD